MHLQPTRPPGRANRKALVHAAEIRRLRASGYSLEAIRHMLAAVGVVVSRSTVHREVTRPDARVPTPPPVASTVGPPIPAPAAAVPWLGPTPFATDPRSGKEIAEAFMKGHITNPLMQVRNPR
ncbi:hypothetical protein [Sphaerotilus mobilis]|nr:hypothetical protein [Sphaerotilus mobilis]